MRAVIYKAKEFLYAEDGPVAVEYAVLLALILGAAIVTMSTFGDNVLAMYEKIVATVGQG